MLRQFILLSFVGLVFGIMTSIASYQAAIKASPKMVTLDTKKILQEFIVDAAKSDLQGDELDDYVAAYTKSLDHITRNLAAQENLIIMPSGAVIAGNIDITAQVEHLIEQGYGKGGSNE